MHKISHLFILYNSPLIFKRILNVTPAKEAGITAGVPNYFESSSGSSKIIKYKRISVYDASTSDLLSYADEIVQFIGNGLHHGSVLVHCQRGVSRSATAVIMFLMRKANMTMNQSLKLCRRRRPMVDPIPTFLDQLRTYEKECRSWGHLTTVDDDDDGAKQDDGNGSAPVEGGDGTEEKYSEKDGNAKNTGINKSGGEKRKADNINCCGSGEKETKKRMVGPIGPARGPVTGSASIGPARGPVKSASIGPAVGPVANNGEQKKKRVVGPIGPARGPVKG